MYYYFSFVSNDQIWLGLTLLAGVSILTGIATGQYVVALIIVAMLLGGAVLESYSVRRASSALSALAHRLLNGEQQDLKLDAVQIGDHLLILPNEISPADAVVVKGQGRMDESFLTGEPYDVKKAPGPEIISGARNGPTLLEVKVLRRPQDSRYAQIIGVMKDSELKRPRLRRLADQIGA